MANDTLLPFGLPAVARKKVTAAFDGGRLSSDGGVLLLRRVERRLGIAARLATCLNGRRDADRIDHTVEEMLRLRMFAIAAGYEDRTRTACGQKSTTIARNDHIGGFPWSRAVTEPARAFSHNRDPKPSLRTPKPILHYRF